MSTKPNSATQAGSQQADRGKGTPVNEVEEEELVDDEDQDEIDADPYDIEDVPDLQTAVGDGTDVYSPENQPKEKPDDWDPSCVIPSGKALEAFMEEATGAKPLQRCKTGDGESHGGSDGKEKGAD